MVYYSRRKRKLLQVFENNAEYIIANFQSLFSFIEQGFVFFLFVVYFSHEACAINIYSNCRVYVTRLAQPIVVTGSECFAENVDFLLKYLELVKIKMSKPFYHHSPHKIGQTCIWGFTCNVTFRLLTNVGGASLRFNHSTCRYVQLF